MPPPAARSDRGFALPLVIWTMTLLAVIALGVMAESRADLVVAHNLAGAAQAEAAADGGVWRTIGLLLADRRGTQWRGDGSPHGFAVGAATVSVAVQDEGGKVDLARADPQVIGNLLRIAGVDDIAAQAAMERLMAWRNAEAGDRTGTIAAAIADGRVLRRLKPFVTDYSRHAGIDPAMAPREVLLAIPGAQTADVDAYLGARGQLPVGASPLDDFPSLAAAMRYFLWSAGTIVTVTATARVDGAVFTRAALVDLAPPKHVPARAYDILAWENPS